MTPSSGSFGWTGHTRLAPPFWDAEWYVLRNLRKALEAELDGRVAPRPGDRVVDLGCGDQPYQPLFSRLGCRYTGCDLSGPADVLIKPGERVPLEDACAEGVLSIQVLEHVWELDWYLGECVRLLKTGGWLLLSTHGTWPYHPCPGDYRRWTRDGLLAELESRGLIVEGIRAIVGPLAWTTQFRLLGLRRLLRRLPMLGSPLLAMASILMNARMVLEDSLTPAWIIEENACVYVTVSRKRSL